MIKSYFEAACAIDLHNHLRQDGLARERTVGTHEWWFRCLCTIIGFIEVDAFKAYCYFNRHATPPQSIKISLRIWLSFYYLIDMMEPLWRRPNMFDERDHWQPGMTALWKRKTPLSIILSLYQSISIRYNIKKQKQRIIRSMAPHLGVACAQSLLHLLITAAQLAAMPMVANHLQCVVLSLGESVEMCMLSLCTIFEECTQCSNCSTGHLTCTYTPNPSLDLMNLICVT